MSDTARFTHLHLHTQYSLLDGTIRLDDLFRKAHDFGMTAIAMTDHGNIYGAVDFYQRAVKAGIKPILGCELYVAPQSRFTKGGQGIGESSNHLVVLVENAEGYDNLKKLTTAAFLEGFYYRPRVDKELLARHHKGLIGMSACLHGEIAERILRGDEGGAAKAAEEYRQIFGAGNFYLEIMQNGLPEQTQANEGLRALSRRLDLPLVATNDCHYLERKDAEAHEVLLCIQTGKTLGDADRMRFATDAFYFRSPDEMTALFADCPEAIAHTAVIADRCNYQFDFGKFYLPHFSLAADETLDERLEHSALEGLEALLPDIVPAEDAVLSERYYERLREELAMIRTMGFAGYFLIVADFVNYAKKNNIPVGPGRGSAAGSLVAYAIGITSIDPIRYRLFFERFLNPDRISMPDIDIDFCQEGRDDIIRYVTEKYGADHVAQIITFGKMQAKAVVRDVGRALSIPYGEVDRIAKLIPNILNIKLDEAIQMEPRLQEAQQKDERIRKLLELSLALEGLNRHSSTHAAGVVISDVPLVERVPLCRSPKDDVVTQFSMNDLQEVGLTKFDFLGLKTLTVIKNTLRFIREGRGVELNMKDLPLNDEKTYRLLMRGETDGVFQLESSGMKDILVNMKPDCIEDVIALIALYRPGPMGMVPEFISRKQGKTKIAYEVKELEDILRETYGVILYQEQVMQIASVIGGYTMAQADTLRKVMSKKIVSAMEKEKPRFLSGAKQNEIPEQKAIRIWEQMESFAAYGFNKSHSTAYAMISYQTAYLKAHYPAEYMAALLTSEKDNRDKIIKYIGVCREMGIQVLPPDINASGRDFSVSGDHIRFGLAGVKHVGMGAIETIVQARDATGEFRSLFDFCSRVDLRKVNRRVIESLIKCGAFDAMGCKRRPLLMSLDELTERIHVRQRDAESRQASMFTDTDESGETSAKSLEEAIPDLPEWEHKERLAYEKDTLGFYITGHPLSKYSERLAMLADTDSVSLSERRDKETVAMAGVVNALREVKTRRKDTMAYVTLEDLKGSFECIFFSEIYRKGYDLLHGDDPLLVRGTIDVGEETVRVMATEIEHLEEATDRPFSSVHFHMTARSVTVETLLSLRDLLIRDYPGKCDGFLHVHDNGTETVVSLGDETRVTASTGLRETADGLIGLRGATIFQ